MRIALLIPLAVIQLVIVRMIAGHVAHRLALDPTIADPVEQHRKPSKSCWVLGILVGVTWPVWAAGWLAWQGASMILRRIPSVGAEADYLAAQRDKEHRERLDEVEMAP